MRREERIPELLARVQTMVGADTALILVPTAGGRELAVLASIGLSGDGQQRLRVPMGDGLAGRVAESREAAVLTEVNGADAASVLTDGARSMVAVPLIGDDRLMGVLQLGARRRRAFSHDDVGLLHILAERIVNGIERSQTTEALRNAEERLRLAVEATELGTWDLDLVGGHFAWDRRAKALFGLSAEAEVTYEGFIAGVHPADRERTHQAVQRALDPTSGGEYHIEFRAVGSVDHVERWIAARGRTVFDEGGEPVRFIGTVLDITDRKHADEERERLLSELRQAVRARDEFLSIASHELRTPLTALDLQLEGLERLLKKEPIGDPGVRLLKKIQVAIRQTDRLTNLVNGLLDVSRISMGRLRLDYEELDIGQLVHEVAERFVDEADRAEAPLVLNIPTPVHGLWDRLRVEQVFINLLSNAIKYGPGKPVMITVAAEGPRVRLTVEDKGIGIAPDDLGRIFGRFERAVSSRHYGGLGLGLYISRQIVEAHGGSIEVISQPEQGATFTVWLPLRPEVKEEGGASGSDRAANAAPPQEAG